MRERIAHFQPEPELVARVLALDESGSVLRDLEERVRAAVARFGQPCADPWKAGLAWVAPLDDDRVLRVSARQEYKEHVELLNEWDGRGAIRLLEVFDDGFSAILERCMPGTRLIDATAAGHTSPDGLDEWIEVASALQSATPPEYVDTMLAEVEDATHEKLERHWPGLWDQYEMDAAIELANRAGAEVLLHADLNPTNILLSNRGWLAIDPKGRRGVASWEAVALLRNPITTAVLDAEYFIERFSERIAALSKATGWDEQQMRAQTLTWAMSALPWSVTLPPGNREEMEMWAKTVALAAAG